MKEQNKQSLVDQLREANIDLMQEVKDTRAIKNAWRFLAWVTLAVLLVSVYVWFMK